MRECLGCLGIGRERWCVVNMKVCGRGAFYCECLHLDDFNAVAYDVGMTCGLGGKKEGNDACPAIDSGC